MQPLPEAAFERLQCLEHAAASRRARDCKDEAHRVIHREIPARDRAIFLAAGVIIVSLIAASLRLLHLLRGLKLPPEPPHQEDEDRARVAAAEAAIQAIEQA
jgi:NhaP-type Na+/H+ or K+/H+ antiporter